MLRVRADHQVNQVAGFEQQSVILAGISDAVLLAEDTVSQIEILVVVASRHSPVAGALAFTNLHSLYLVIQQLGPGGYLTVDRHGRSVLCVLSGRAVGDPAALGTHGGREHGSS